MQLSPWRRVRADPAEWFSADEIAKAREYTRGLRRINGSSKAAALVADLVFVRAHAAPRLLRWLGVHNWVGRLAVTIAAMTVVGIVVGIGFDAWRELSYDKRFGFSTQTGKGFAADQAKNALVVTVVFFVLFLPLWAVVRATPLWWVWGWVVMAVTLLVIGVLAPVLIMPLFNRFTPISDADLRDDLLAVGRKAGADLAEIEVSDASRRTRKDNAFVTGMGKTRRLVLFDTLLSRPREQVRAVAAHEIGHWKLKHVRRTVPMSIGSLFVLFLVLRLVMGWDAALRFAGVSSVRDPAVLPLFMFVFMQVGVVTNLASSWLSRASEREADLFALQVTGDPPAFVEAMRVLHTDNLADLTPSLWRRLTMTHPPAAERMAMGTAWSAASQSRD